MSLDSYYRNRARTVERAIARSEEAARADDVGTVVNFSAGRLVVRMANGEEVSCLYWGAVTPTPGQPIATVSNGSQRVAIGGGQHGT